VLSNLYNPAAQIGQPQCPVYNNSCSVISTVPRDQAIAAANGGGCNTTRATSASPAALAGLAGLLGLALVRARRRRLGGR
jgi:MYXO-CTERM domain-containing protein